MNISDLNYLETVSEDVVGGGPLNFLGSVYQVNQNMTRQDAASVAFIHAIAVTQSPVRAKAYNTNYTKQSNHISQD